MKTVHIFKLTLMLFLVINLSFNATAQEASSCQNKAFLGVVMSPDAADIQGVKISDIVEKSTAAELGLQAGDIITKIDDANIANADELIATMKTKAVGDNVNVLFLRNNKTQKATATLKARTNQNYHHFNKNPRLSTEKNCWERKSCDQTNNNKVLLGVFSEATNADVIEDYNLKKVKAGEGVFIKKIVAGSAAEDAGLQVADVILKVGKTKVNTRKSLIATLANYEIGDSEKISYIRNGKKAKTTVTFKANKANCEWTKDCDKSKCKPSDCQKKIEKIIIQDGENDEEIKAKLKDLGIDMDNIFENLDSDGNGDIQIFKGNGEALNFNLNEMLEHLGENNKELKKHLEDIDINMGDALKNIEGDIRIFKEDIENFDLENFNLNDMLKNLGTDVQIFEEESEEDGRKMKKIIIIQDDENATGKVSITEPDAEDMAMMENILKQKAETSQKTMATSLESVKDITFYPNPNDGKFVLKFDVPKEVATTIRIIDTKGQSVYEQELPAFVGQYHQEINISERNAGLYLLQIVQGNEVMMRKILIQ